MKQWEIISKLKPEREEEVFPELLKIRGIKNYEVSQFLNPSVDTITLDSIGISKKEFSKAKKRIEKAIKENEGIVIFGDYDVDGVCASAILWETFYKKTKKVYPYIPDRLGEGYGLSEKGIDTLIEKYPATKLIITVDNGIVASKAVSYANAKNIDVIITDHHQKSESDPEAFAILHTTKLCGAGIAWVISRELEYDTKENNRKLLELAALATIADLVPLFDANRAIVIEGIKQLRKTERVGLRALYKEAGIESEKISEYSIGHMIAPRINATGRIASALDSLRLICTTSKEKADEYGRILAKTNRDRQDLTEGSVTHAKLLALEIESTSRVIVVADNSYNQGIVGLIASQLVEVHYKPSFAISKGEEVSKGSARSVAGVNIVELLRSVSHTLLEVGGHQMAAGFSLETKRIQEFIEELSAKAKEVVLDGHLQRIIKIDLEIELSLITPRLIKTVKTLSPFGMGNPEPLFITKNVEIAEVRKIGKDLRHLKLKLRKNNKMCDAVAFKFADKIDLLQKDVVDIVYAVDENEWRGKRTIQLLVKDIRLAD